MTRFGSDKEQYDAVTVLFHWATAALVIALFGSAMAWSYAPRDWGFRSLETVHVSLGVTLSIVILARLLWRWTAGRRLADIGNPTQRVLAKLVHLVLYGLLVLQVALGFGLEWFGGESLSFFGMASIPSPFAENRDLSQQLEQLHGVVAWSLMVVVGGHAAAALWHRYVNKDAVLQRMLLSRTSG